MNQIIVSNHELVSIDNYSLDEIFVWIEKENLKNKESDEYVELSRLLIKIIGNDDENICIETTYFLINYIRNGVKNFEHLKSIINDHIYFNLQQIGEITELENKKRFKDDEEYKIRQQYFDYLKSISKNYSNSVIKYNTNILEKICSAIDDLIENYSVDKYPYICEFIERMKAKRLADV